MTGWLCAHLRLDGVEVRESVERLVLRAAQGRNRQRVEVQQLGVRRVALGQDQALEGQRQERLRVQPPVRHRPAHSTSAWCPFALKS